VLPKTMKFGALGFGSGLRWVPALKRAPNLNLNLMSLVGTDLEHPPHAAWG